LKYQILKNLKYLKKYLNTQIMTGIWYLVFGAFRSIC